MAVAAAGCATGSSDQRHIFGNRQWSVRLPTTQNPVQALTQENGGEAAQAAPAAGDEQDELTAAPRTSPRSGEHKPASAVARAAKPTSKP